MICDRCGQPVETGDHGLYRCPLEPQPSRGAVRPDTIRGGLWIAHGLCAPDGTPRRYDSQRAITRECEARGLVRWTDVHEAARTKDAEVYTDWLRSGEARRLRADRQAQRRARAAAEAGR